MAEFKQNVESERFLQVVDDLTHRQIVDSDAEFCRLAGFSPQSLSHIRKQKRNVTLELISKLYSTFGGSVLYVFTGKGPKVIDESEQQDLTIAAEPRQQYQQDAVIRMSKEIEQLKRLLEVQIQNAEVNVKYVKHLEDTIGALNKELLLLKK